MVVGDLSSPSGDFHIIALHSAAYTWFPALRFRSWLIRDSFKNT